MGGNDMQATLVDVHDCGSNFCASDTNFSSMPIYTLLHFGFVQLYPSLPVPVGPFLITEFVRRQSLLLGLETGDSPVNIVQ